MPSPSVGGNRNIQLLEGSRNPSITISWYLMMYRYSEKIPYLNSSWHFDYEVFVFLPYLPYMLWSRSQYSSHGINKIWKQRSNGHTLVPDGSTWHSAMLPIPSPMATGTGEVFRMGTVWFFDTLCHGLQLARITVAKRIRQLVSYVS